MNNDKKPFRPHMQMTAKFWDKDAKLYYEYRLGLVAEDRRGPCLKDFEDFIKKIWPYMQEGRPKEEFLKDIGEEEI